MASNAETAGDGRSECSTKIETELNTMFILDMMRQKREKLMRLKKDEMINEAARKQREKMQQIRCGNYVCDGTGFRGVNQILQEAERSATPQPWRHKRHE